MGEVTKAVLDCDEVEFGFGEYLAARKKCDLGSAARISSRLVGRTDYGDGRVGFAHVATHEVFLAVAPNAQIEHFRKRVYYCQADTVQQAGHLERVL